VISDKETGGRGDLVIGRNGDEVTWRRWEKI